MAKETTVVVMERYEVRGIDDPDAFLGEGAFSMVWKGFDTKKNDAECAVKTYKVDPKDRKGKCVSLLKFKRQIEVLQDLARPLDKSKVTKSHWNDDLENIDMHDMFLQLYDYSKDAKDDPGMHKDGGFYVITELASYSLQDYLTDRRDAKINLTMETIASVSYDIMLVGASLHAKGLVHLDIKPENIMKINGRWKLIDVDGCVKHNERISIDDATISFSPVYCSPEFARFPIGDSDYLTIKVSMDVWSVGLCVAELYLLDVLIGPAFAKEIAPDTKLDAGFAILEWLANPAPLEFPAKLKKSDKDYVNLLQGLLEKSVSKRLTFADALKHPFVAKYAKKKDAASTVRSSEDEQAERRNKLNRAERHRARAIDKDQPMFAGVLAKLNSDGDMMKETDWLKRDFWLTTNGGLCYFSKKENRALVLLDSSLVKCATFSAIPDGKAAVPWAFEVKLPWTEEGIERKPECFSAENSDARDTWLKMFERTQVTDVRKTANFRDMKAFRLRIRNQRKVVDESQSEPAFKSLLFKLNQDGDPKNPEHWLKREMWIAKNGSLCYFSKKENRVLMYQNADDVKEATLSILKKGETAQEYAFEMVLPLKDGMEFEPCVFAAETAAERDVWIEKFRALAKK
eukprot:GEMP01019050.1.p1 GENE.GEMP01019050.1~~GEMP01019050.1.p1  ORF type:complete len:629 (+),score=124.86 GEMP01019050.1:148-2034(+)